MSEVSKQQTSAQNVDSSPAAASPTGAAPPPQQAPEVPQTTGATQDARAGTGPTTPPAAEAVRAVKYRHQWLQTPTHVEVSLAAPAPCRAGVCGMGLMPHLSVHGRLCSLLSVVIAAKPLNSVMFARLQCCTELHGH
jgi:hypothetical protein